MRSEVVGRAGQLGRVAAQEGNPLSARRSVVVAGRVARGRRAGQLGRWVAQEGNPLSARCEGRDGVSGQVGRECGGHGHCGARVPLAYFTYLYM